MEKLQAAKHGETVEGMMQQLELALFMERVTLPPRNGLPSRTYLLDPGSVRRLSNGYYTCKATVEATGREVQNWTTLDMLGRALSERSV